MAVTGALVLLSVAPPASAADVRLKVREHVLDNGLKLLVHEDHDVPNAALYVTWRVGSRNERPGITGLAHFFEHMMFTGGARYGSSFDPTMEAAGGSNNAWTSQDVTTYTDWFPSSALPLILDMEADRMSGMVFTPKGIASERGVVASERRLNMEEPASVMSEQLFAAAYTAHPYQWPVLGWMVDIENWKQSDLEEFFATHYAPNNCTVVVAGDVDPAEVLEMVREKMGGIPRRPKRRPVHTREPEQLGERRVSVVNRQANLAQIMIAWHMVETSHPDFPVFDVLERMLLVGDSSRLHRLLVEDERVCLSVGGGWQGHQFDPSLFTVEVRLREGQDPARVESLLYGALAELGRDGPGERELRKVKNGLRSTFVRRMKTIDGKAELIAETETFFGGWAKLGARVEALDAVTASDVKRVLSGTFTRKNRTVCTLEIAPAGGEASK